MPVNGMNVGIDYSFGLFDVNTNALVDLGDIQNVVLTANKHDIKSMPYNNVPRFGYVPDGFKGTFTLLRTKADIEDLAILLAQNFQAGAVVQAGYLNQSVSNPDGSARRYQYTRCVFFLTDHGTISRETTVKQTVEWWASDKVRIS